MVRVVHVANSLLDVVGLDRERGHDRRSGLDHGLDPDPGLGRGSYEPEIA